MFFVISGLSATAKRASETGTKTYNDQTIRTMRTEKGGERARICEFAVSVKNGNLTTRVDEVIRVGGILQANEIADIFEALQFIREYF